MHNNTDDTIYNDLVNFIRMEFAVRDFAIQRNTEIEEGLGITGDDAEELMIKFAKKFKVDISNFQFNRFFNDEPSPFSFGHNVKSFTVGHLEKAAKTGRLDNSIINDE